MPPLFEECWKGLIVLTLLVRPSPSASGDSNLRLSFSGGVIRDLWTHFSSTDHSEVVPLLQCFFDRVPMVSCVRVFHYENTHIQI